MALAGKRSRSGHRVFVLMSDGECDEGSIWEAAMFSAHHQLDNLVAVIDYNKLQSLGSVSETLGLEPLADKWASFGWSVVPVDGHCHTALRAALARVPAEPRKPLCLIAHTVKGKGVGFMENSVLWHYRSPQGPELDAALEELEREPCEMHSFAG
jgi:transketolase